MMEVSDMSLRGQGEMKWLMRFVILCFAGFLSMTFLVPSGRWLWLALMCVVVLSPFLLYVLDRLEQKHPKLQPWFNPFDSRGQIGVVGILTGFLMIVVYTSLIPAINAVIDAQLPNLGTTESLLLNLVHVFFIVGILGSIYFYSRPQ